MVARTPPKKSIPARPRLSRSASVADAAAAHPNERHVTFRDQCVLASSSENKTPPIGRQRRRETRRRAALTNSRCVACDAKSNISRDVAAARRADRRRRRRSLDDETRDTRGP